MSAEPHAHHPSMRIYFLIWAALILLTLSTVGLTYVDLGILHSPIGLTIAAIKAALIVLVFMHARESGRFVWMVIAVAVLFLAILFGITWTDYVSRGLDNQVRDPAASHIAQP